MPRTRECDYCGTEIEAGTGTMFVHVDGTTVHYCSAKCEKNADLGREPRDQEWTAAGQAAAGAEAEPESEPEPEPEEPEPEATPDLEEAEEADETGADADEGDESVAADDEADDEADTEDPEETEA
jgi:large subunit ribosomal protein L24e